MCCRPAFSDSVRCLSSSKKYQRRKKDGHQVQPSTPRNQLPHHISQVRKAEVRWLLIHTDIWWRCACREGGRLRLLKTILNFLSRMGREQDKDKAMKYISVGHLCRVVAQIIAQSVFLIIETGSFFFFWLQLSFAAVLTKILPCCIKQAHKHTCLVYRAAMKCALATLNHLKPAMYKWSDESSWKQNEAYGGEEQCSELKRKFVVLFNCKKSRLQAGRQKFRDQLRTSD